MGFLKNLFKKKEDPKNNYSDLLIKMAEDGDKDLIWLLLGSLISADQLVSIEACENSILMLGELKESIHDVPDHLYTPEEKEKIIKFCNYGLEICNRDLEDFKNNEAKEIQ